MLKTNGFGCGNTFEQVQTRTVIANGTAAGVFGLAWLFALFILVRYLIIQNRCQQKTMIIFYIIVLCNLGSRIIYFVFSCFVAQKAEYLVLVASISTVASVMAGVSHSQNLSRLIVDLALARSETQESYDKLVRRRYIFHGLLVFWLIVSVIYLVIIGLDHYKWGSLDETILFGLLGVQLLIINFILLRLMKRQFS